MKSDVAAVLTAMTDAERPWVQQALASILNQTRMPDEIVIMVEKDNAWFESDIAARAYDPVAIERIRVHRMPLALLGAVRNAGVRLANTRWVAFLDGDDVWKSNRIEAQLNAVEANPKAQFIGGDYVFIDASGRPFAFSNGSTPTPSSWLVDRQLLIEYPFDPSLKLGEDHFWLQQTRPVCQRIRVPRVLVEYRIRGMSISSLQNGASRQRRIREAMARAAGNPLLRYLMMGPTYARYLLCRHKHYAL